MSFNISDFFLKDIIYTAKGNIENDFFKVTVDNVDYPALISRVGTALIGITICCMRRQVNNENPIEKKIIEYNEHDYNIFEKYGKNWDVDFLDSEKFFFRANLYYLFDEIIFDFADINERTQSYLIDQMEKGEVICLSSSEITFKDLENSNSELEAKLKKFIYEKCTNEYSDNEKLQNDLILTLTVTFSKVKLVSPLDIYERVSEIKF